MAERKDASTATELADFVSRMGADRSLRVEENLGDGFVRLRVSEAERRQAKQDIRCVEDGIIELLRNARDAGAQHIMVATGREANLRRVVVIDDGCGIPAALQERVFDARVTSKLDSFRSDLWGVHGRGMALFSLKENAPTARVIESAPGLGTSIGFSCDVEKLPERADQSSWPELSVDEDGAQRLGRGPHNIVRACSEFALEERGVCEVYVGSAAEIAATARARVKPHLSSSELLFLDALTKLPILERFSAATDAADLLDVSHKAGLEMSERTAHRIIAGQVRPVRSVLARLTHASSRHPPQQDLDLGRDRRRLRVSKPDEEEFSRIMARDFGYLAGRYYLRLSDDPRLRVRGHSLTVTFEFEDDD